MLFSKYKNLFLSLIICFLLFFYIISHIYIYIFSELKTENISLISQPGFINAKAVFFRDEGLITEPCSTDFKNNLKKMFVNNLESSSCTEFTDFVNLNSLKIDNNFKNNLNKLDKIFFLNTNFSSNDIKCCINNEIIKMKSSINYNNYNSEKNLLRLIYEYEKIKKENYEKYELNSEINLPFFLDETKEKNISNKINFKEEGVLGFFTDGFEDFLKLDNFSKENFLNDEKINEIFSLYDSILFKKNIQETNENIKIIKSLNCIVICKIDGNFENLKINIGEDINMFLSLNKKDELKCKVLEKKQSKNVLVLKTSLIPEILNSRMENVKIKTSEICGLKINKKAVRNKNDKIGVYVLKNKKIIFKPINILFSNDEYLICENEKDNKNSLKIEEKVVVSWRLA